jgi:hypothetical protein
MITSRVTNKIRSRHKTRQNCPKTKNPHIKPYYPGSKFGAKNWAPTEASCGSEEGVEKVGNE